MSDLKPTADAAFAVLAVLVLTCAHLAPVEAQSSGQRPNIVVFWGDDIGLSNISAYSLGVMGYRTPNIDRIATEGLMFTDYYAEQSCTADRALFITGHSGLRTGMTKVGVPAATLGLRKEDPTIAEMLKPAGPRTRTTRPMLRASAASVDKCARTPARSPSSAWRVPTASESRDFQPRRRDAPDAGGGRVQVVRRTRSCRGLGGIRMGLATAHGPQASGCRRNPVGWSG